MTRAGHGGANRAFVVSAWGLDGGHGGGPLRHTDTRIQDPQALAEIELYGELVIAASASEEPLSRDEIDRVLGLDHLAGGDPRSA